MFCLTCLCPWLAIPTLLHAASCLFLCKQFVTCVFISDSLRTIKCVEVLIVTHSFFLLSGKLEAICVSQDSDGSDFKAPKLCPKLAYTHTHTHTPKIEPRLWQDGFACYLATVWCYILKRENLKHEPSLLWLVACSHWSTELCSIMQSVAWIKNKTALLKRGRGPRLIIRALVLNPVPWSSADAFNAFPSLLQKWLVSRRYSPCAGNHSNK